MVDTMQDWPDYQKMVETLQEWPEYQEILDYLRGKGVDVDRYVELVRTLHSLSRRGKAFSDWKFKHIAYVFVLKCLKFHNVEWHINMIFELTNTQLIISKETAVT
jgi:hypothetical protein